MAKKQYFQESELVFKEKPSHPRFNDLTGQYFGRLKVLGFSDRVNQRTIWLCECSCGKITTIASQELNNGEAKSCGCLRREVTKLKSQTHGHSVGKKVTSTYTSYSMMIDRCSNENGSNFEYYKGRGITVCDRWLESFENFLADMGERPEGLTLERIENEKGYCQENCRWASRKEQANNRRSNRIIEFDGQKLNVSQWAEKIGVKNSLIADRIRFGWPLEKALTTPVKMNRLC